ncbi:Glycosyltransferase WbsX [Phyllobacterium sp. YR620]|uniref:glycosyltransferase WbsX family protein n=1 Tax=Phyllobacterium sp. YR620 TaxID=1881066 RepID=UPI0008853ACC|nr:glycoside hydrolase family 99-like domain-containing protein [Phyllobacterium sp. YR620]SDP58051.1 Glycosyltransferase WbsX [Phyllobacterium sp. YR620]
MNRLFEPERSESAANPVGRDVSDSGRSLTESTDTSKLIAFYLPQFHRVKENSAWWGPGFTEWTNVARGRPNFDGHYQPHIPRELGFYDLSYVEPLAEQAALARQYGIHGFCFYHYWFSGRRILERPAENFLKSDIDIKFCLCWANENWTRTWDGDTRSVLLEQKYADGDDEAFIASLIDYFKDDRYIKIDGKPLLVVYHAKEIPNPKKSFAVWREFAKRQGFPDLHIAAVDFYDISAPEECGADALVEFPPHKFIGSESRPDRSPVTTNPEFSGRFVDYRKMVAQSINRPVPAFRLYRGIIPSWDNTARRQNTATTIINSNPSLYGRWLRYLRAYTRTEFDTGEDNFIFINAWNEWGEGCHLEPDQKWGLSYLEETRDSSFYKRDHAAEQSIEAARSSAIETLTQAFLDSDPATDARTIAEKLSDYRPPSQFTRKLSGILVRWPWLHRTVKTIFQKINA